MFVQPICHHLLPSSLAPRKGNGHGRQEGRDVKAISASRRHGIWPMHGMLRVGGMTTMCPVMTDFAWIDGCDAVRFVKQLGARNDGYAQAGLSRCLFVSLLAGNTTLGPTQVNGERHYPSTISVQRRGR